MWISVWKRGKGKGRKEGEGGGGGTENRQSRQLDSALRIARESAQLLHGSSIAQIEHLPQSAVATVVLAGYGSQGRGSYSNLLCGSRDDCRCGLGLGGSYGSLGSFRLDYGRLGSTSRCRLLCGCTAETWPSIYCFFFWKQFKGVLKK